MATQNSFADNNVSRGLLAVDGETDAETRRIHSRTRGSVNATVVEIVDASGNQVTSFGGGTQYAVDAALGATPTGTLAVAIRDDALSALTPIEGDAIGLRVDANGALWTIINGSVAVTGTFWQATQPVSAASLPLPTGASTEATLAAINAKLVTGTVIGDVNLGATDNAVLDAIESDTTAIQTAIQIMDDWDNAASDGASVSGDVAHDATDAGEPVKVGGKATNVEPAAVSATGDRANFITDMVGKQIILPYANPENFVSGAITTAMTGTTSTSLLAAPAAGLRNYITQITVSNAHATVGTDVIIQDGSGGTTLYTIPAAAVYGGATVTFPVPLRQPTTATAIFCANVTTGASTKVSASGYKGI